DRRRARAPRRAVRARLRGQRRRRDERVSGDRRLQPRTRDADDAHDLPQPYPHLRDRRARRHPDLPGRGPPGRGAHRHHRQAQAADGPQRPALPGADARRLRLPASSRTTPAHRFRALLLPPLAGGGGRDGGRLALAVASPFPCSDAPTPTLPAGEGAEAVGRKPLPLPPLAGDGRGGGRLGGAWAALSGCPDAPPPPPPRTRGRDPKKPRRAPPPPPPRGGAAMGGAWPSRAHPRPRPPPARGGGSQRSRAALPPLPPLAGGPGWGPPGPRRGIPVPVLRCPPPTLPARGGGSQRSRGARSCPFPRLRGREPRRLRRK